MFIWVKKATHGNYSLENACQTYVDCIRYFVERTMLSHKIETIVFPIGQDFFNFDNLNGSTTKGTPQSSTCDLSEMYKAGLSATISALSYLYSICSDIKVMYVSGNHDNVLSYCLVENLQSAFNAYGGISFDTSKTPRKYIQYGDCMIAYSHGDEETKARLNQIMQAEQPVIWGKTKFRELHTGHLHSEHVTEEMGFKKRRISSISPNDEWHNKKGYVGALPMAQAFVWSKAKGLTDIMNHVVSYDD